MIDFGPANDQLPAAVVVASLHIHDESILSILVNIRVKRVTNTQGQVQTNIVYFVLRCTQNSRQALIVFDRQISTMVAEKIDGPALILVNRVEEWTLVAQLLRLKVHVGAARKQFQNQSIVH